MIAELSPQSRFLLKASLAGAFAEAMLLPVFAIFTEKVGGSMLDAGIGFGIFEIVSGLFVILVGSTAWFQRNVRPIVFAGFLLSSLAEFSYLFVHTRGQLFLVQGMVGIAVGMMNPAWDCLYAEDATEQDSARNWSMWSGGVNLSQGAAALAGGLVVSRFGFQSLFAIMAVVNCFAVFFAAKVLLLKPERKQPAMIPVALTNSANEPA